MKNLLLIEKEYYQLQKRLSLSYSSRYKTDQIFSFIQSISDPTNIISYLLEIITPLADVVLKLEGCCINPCKLENYIHLLEGINKSTNPTNLKNKIDELLIHIHGEKKALETRIANKFLPNKEFSFNKKRKGIKRLFETDLKTQCEVVIPFIEREPFLGSVKPEYGTLRKLKIRVEKSLKHDAEDEIEIGLNTDQDKRKEYQSFIQLAKEMFRAVTGIKISEKLTVHCSLEDQNIISGNSIEAGLVTGIFISLFKLHDLRITFDLPETLAITGRVDKQGNLLPVDEDGLKLKIEACAFSSITNLIVPKEQESFCTDYLKQVESGFNGQKLLNIHGVENVEEIYYDRRNVEQSVATFTGYTISKIWKKRRSIVAILFLVMAVVIGKTYLGPIDKHPAKILFEGKDLIIENSWNEEVKRIEIGEKYIKDALDSYVFGDSLANLIDVDLDGYKDLIFIDKRQNYKYYDQVKCFSVIKDSMLWEFKVRKKLRINGVELIEDQFNARFLYVGDYDHDKKKEVYILTSSNYSPAIIFKIDGLTGEERELYTHYGHLQVMKFCDLDNDGREELLAAGTNQVFGTSCLIVLDPKNINGSGPLNKHYQFNGWPEAKEKFYISIPFTIVAKTLADGKSYSMALLLTIKSKFIKLDVRDIDTPNQPPSFYIYFDYNLNPIKAECGDIYNHYAESLYKQKMISFIPDSSYFKTFLKQIKYLKKRTNH